jgi:hypothetical protein
MVPRPSIINATRNDSTRPSPISSPKGPPGPPLAAHTASPRTGNPSRRRHFQRLDAPVRRLVSDPRRRAQTAIEDASNDCCKKPHMFNFDTPIKEQASLGSLFSASQTRLFGGLLAQLKIAPREGDRDDLSCSYLTLCKPLVVLPLHRPAPALLFSIPARRSCSGTTDSPMLGKRWSSLTQRVCQELVVGN